MSPVYQIVCPRPNSGLIFRELCPLPWLTPHNRNGAGTGARDPRPSDRLGKHAEGDSAAFCPPTSGHRRSGPLQKALQASLCIVPSWRVEWLLPRKQGPKKRVCSLRAKLQPTSSQSSSARTRVRFQDPGAASALGGEMGRYSV